MKLLSLNVALFEKNNGQLKDFVRSLDIDLACFQEVTRKVDLTTNNDLVTYNLLTDNLTKLPHSFYGPIWQLESFTAPNFHGNETFEFNLGGMVEFGNLFLSKYKIINGENRFVQESFSVITDWPTIWGNEPRAVLVSDVNGGKSKLRVINYHGIWSRDKQGTDKTNKACEAIRDIALAVDYPSIICGDFNLFPDTESIKILNERFTNLCDEYQIKSTRPQSNELSNKARNVVDYVFVSKDIRVSNFEVINTNVSDHLPLVMEFDI